tara:strand:+ start:165 stop:1835 length:1671 start_codon:yes stop_codon:yes gene_type:complete
MADIKDFTSLLGKKNSGINFGEIAQAYFSQGSKKSNRGRNALIASFFINAKESVMQSKVMQNLQDLADRKTIATAEVKNNYDNKFKLQTKYDDIKSQGLNEYYDADSETAFTKYVTNLGMSTRFDGSNEDANKMKQDWKSNYSKNEYRSFIENEYNPTKAGRLGSFEAYAEPVLNKFKAERRKITSPSEVSLVHNVLNKVGIGEKRNQKLEKNYVKAEESYQTLIKERDDYNNPAVRGATPTLGRTSVKSIKISMDNFDEEAARFNIGTDTAIYRDAFKRFNVLSPENRTVGAAEELLVNNTINQFLIENEEKINEVTEKFMANKPRLLKQGISESELTRELASQIRTATGMTSMTKDMEDDARFYTDLHIKSKSVKFSSEEDRKAYIKAEDAKYIQAQINKGRGLLSKERVAQNIRITTSTQLAAEARLQPNAYRGVVRSTPVSDDLKLLLKDNNPEAFKFLVELDKTGGLSDSRNNTRVENSPYSIVLFQLQKRQYEENQYTNIKRLLDITTAGDEAIKGYEMLSVGQKETVKDKQGYGSPSYNMLDEVSNNND